MNLSPKSGSSEPVLPELPNSNGYVPDRIVLNIELEQNGCYTATTSATLMVRSILPVALPTTVIIPYNRYTEAVEFVAACVETSSGKRTELSPESMCTDYLSQTPTAPMFNHGRRKIICFPPLSQKDRFAWTTKRLRALPLFPNEFQSSNVFDRVYRSVEVRLRAPKEKSIFWSKTDLAFRFEEIDGVVHYMWHTQHDMDSQSIPLERRLTFSTFESYAKLGDTIADAVGSRLQEHPEIRALASLITGDCVSDLDAAIRINKWLVEHFRFLPVPFGQATAVPHSPTTVVRNGYGDSKDLATLFVSLLRAKMIDCEVVLTNRLYESCELPSVVDLGPFNHMIVWLSAQKLYADPSAELAGGKPIPDLHGRPALHIRKQASILRGT